MCGSSKPVTQTTTQQLSPEQRELLNFGMTQARGAIETQPDLPAVQGFDKSQVAAQEGVLAKAGQGGMVADAANQGAATQRFLSKDVLDVNNNPAFKGALDAALRPITENFQNVVLPGLRTQAVAAGPTALGGSRQKLAEANASAAYMRQLGDTAASMGNEAYKTGVDASVKAQALLPTTMQAMLFPEVAQDTVGAERRTLAQQEAAQPLMQNELDWSRALQLLSASSAVPGGGTTSTVTPATGGSAAGMGLGALMAVAGLATGNPMLIAAGAGTVASNR